MLPSLPSEDMRQIQLGDDTYLSGLMLMLVMETADVLNSKYDFGDFVKLRGRRKGEKSMTESFYTHTRQST